ncbi:MAG: NIL domain-containing protein [Thermacetogeniaceae bacterium]|nr:NIL domain-containing protein [Thermoanaerobacterales bacterium]NLN21719.1 4Fe-4S binding protein [Syntrophomonadaceae bacterium]HAF17909.1 (Fe-S)-binding protein [Peptococcaceae bacterium]
MVANKFVLRFSSALVDQPVIYHLVKDYDLVINILKADINPHQEGYVVLELSGDSENYNRGLEYLKSTGVDISPLSGTIFWNKDRCLQCGACTSFCPTNALKMDPQERLVDFDGSRCIVCESCLDVCMARAVEVRF